MNIQPTVPSPALQAASVAGASRSAERGGEQALRTSDAARQQATSEAPAGKSGESSAIDAGEQTGDRGGDGRQTYDEFQHSGNHRPPVQPDPPAPDSAPKEHIDFQA